MRTMTPSSEDAFLKFKTALRRKVQSQNRLIVLLDSVVFSSVIILLLSAVLFNQEANTPEGKKFQFTNVPLSEVVNDLELAFGCTISLQDKSIGACLITGTFLNIEKVDDVLEAIGSNHNLKVANSGHGKLILSGRGCIF
jgi:hypothetical protein